MPITYAVQFDCEIRRQAGDHQLARHLATASARPFTAPCQGCPANPHARPLGCFGTVGQPLTAADEQWLLDRLPRDLSTTAGYMLHSALDDFGWDGGYAAQLRQADAARIAAGATPHHFANPVAARVDGALDINANQVFDLLFGEGHVQAAHPLLLCLFFGLVPHDTPPPRLAALRSQPATLRSLLSLPTEEHDLSRVLHAIATAAQLGRQLFTTA